MMVDTVLMRFTIVSGEWDHELLASLLVIVLINLKDPFQVSRFTLLLFFRVAACYPLTANKKQLFLTANSAEYVAKDQSLTRPMHGINWNAITRRSPKHAFARRLFADDPERFNNFSISFEDILFDYSKNHITAKNHMSLLLDLAEECKLSEAIEAMFTGDVINETEGRSVLHTALRNIGNEPVYSEGKNVMPQVHQVQQQMKQFCERIHSGEWTGYTGSKIKYIVNIGIGGSDLGPYMVTEALKPYWKKDIQVFYVSNVDATHIVETLRKVTPQETLFLVASKTFTTQETMTNAHTARQWFLEGNRR